MSGFLVKATTAMALGGANIARAGWYRAGVKLGLNPVRRLRASVPEGPFFSALSSDMPCEPAVSLWKTVAHLFGRWSLAVSDQAPDWHANPLTGERMRAADRGWWEIPDFDAAVGDIKLIWELSRFDWVIAFAQQARAGDSAALDRLNDWLADWCRKNPPYRGPNWKCGQEASIRVMHLSVAALILEQTGRSLPAVRDMIHLHLRRIEPTIQYAVAQDNNHGTSEAAALFIGGHWLAGLGVQEGQHWSRLGRKWLEQRVSRLVGTDGSFSQYSLNYHRMMLDTLCLAEVWRQHLSLPAFSTTFQQRARAAAEWLYRIVDVKHGDGPNLGANDGARLLQLADTPYRDHRPTVQMAVALFAGMRAYGGNGPWNLPSRWLCVALPAAVASAPSDSVGDDGGFAVLRRGAGVAVLRYPRFKFRPSQADALHLDLWVDGVNLCRDAGSYSYNTEPRWFGYFGGTAGHNTVQFDDRDQMPRLSRFLFGAWLKTSFIEPLTIDESSTRFAAGYRDAQGASHHRHVSLADSYIDVVDHVAGFKDKAVLRWRLAPGPWRINGNVATNGEHVLVVDTDVPIVRCEIVDGWESRHYLEKTPVPVLEIEVKQATKLKTRYRWAA